MTTSLFPTFIVEESRKVPNYIVAIVSFLLLNIVCILNIFYDVSILITRGDGNEYM